MNHPKALTPQQVRFFHEEGYLIVPDVFAPQDLEPLRAELHKEINRKARELQAAGKLTNPDIALFYATPGAMIYFVNGLQWSGYKRFDWSVVGESACADSWGRALTTRAPSLSIPCFAERRYGGVLDDEMLMAAPPEYLVKAIAGMRALSRNGFRYPFPQYGVQQDVRAGMAVSYRN